MDSWKASFLRAGVYPEKDQVRSHPALLGWHILAELIPSGRKEGLGSYRMGHFQAVFARHIVHILEQTKQKDGRRFCYQGPKDSPTKAKDRDA